MSTTLNSSPDRVAALAVGTSGTSLLVVVVRTTEVAPDPCLLLAVTLMSYWELGRSPVMTSADGVVTV